MRLKLPALLAFGAVVGLVIVFATDQVVPATSTREAQLRLWLAARATGISVELLLTAQVGLGLILSHPVNQSTWKLSKTIYPWHENLLVFTIAFVAAHVVSLVLDPVSGVGLSGAFVPGLSSYRSVPVALGTLSLYALLLTAVTARYTRLLPQGWWLKLHRLSLVVWIGAWVHGITSGTDSAALIPLYVGTGSIVVAAAAYRYWVTRKAKRTFATSLERGRTLQAPPTHGSTALRGLERATPEAAAASLAGRPRPAATVPSGAAEATASAQSFAPALAALLLEPNRSRAVSGEVKAATYATPPGVQGAALTSPPRAPAAGPANPLVTAGRPRGLSPTAPRRTLEEGSLS